MSVASLRKGWCPGALRPMPSGDGLIVRLKPTGGALTAGTAARIAGMAARYGSGAIDLTQRANLQLRGIREKALAPLTDELNALELLDATPEAEAVRNVLLSPLAGIDPACKDGTAIAHALETELGQDVRLHALPAKFGFAVDGGGQWPLGETGADITAYATDDTQDWRVSLAGSEVTSAAVPWHAVAETMLALAQVFLANGLPAGSVRMRELGTEDVFATAGVATGPSVNRRTRTVDVGYSAPTPSAHLSAIGLPFGRIDAPALAALVDTVPHAAIRLTPWRVMAFVCGSNAEAQKVLEAADELQLVTSPDDIRLAIDACTGAPACANATTETRVDAALLAQLLTGRVIAPGTIHVSGCAKGCAHRGAAAVTFVGRDGCYDLVRNGTPSDVPVRSGIGRAELAAALSAKGDRP
jgi:precorrin-3B synthase